MITVHHLEHSRSERLMWLLEEMGLPYEVRCYQRTAAYLAPDALAMVHPLGKSPVLVDDTFICPQTARPMVLIESGAIIEYLIHRYGGERWAAPSEPMALQRFRQWMHFAEGSMMLPLVLQLIFKKIEQATLPWGSAWLVRPIAKQISQNVLSGFVIPTQRKQLSWIDRELQGREWLMGEVFSAVDIQMGYALTQLPAESYAQYSNLRRYIECLQARPAYQKTKC